MVSLFVQGHMCGVMAKITKAKISFNQRFQRLPSHDEIAEMINVQASIVRLVCERSRLPLSLDRVVTDQGCMALQVPLLNLKSTFLNVCDFINE